MTCENVAPLEWLNFDPEETAYVAVFDESTVSPTEAVITMVYHNMNLAMVVPIEPT